MTKKHHHGGDVLGRGSYGCAVTPPPGCSHISQTDTQNKVSKLFFDKDSMKNELRLMRKLNKLDPNNDFTIEKYDECSIPFEKIPQQDRDICEAGANRFGDRVGQIIYAYGGIDLSKTNAFFEDLLPSFLNVIKGLKILHEEKIVHGDIKPKNLMIKDNVIKIIDWGLSSKGKDIYKKRELMNYSYPYYPPEFVISGILVEGNLHPISNKERIFQVLLRNQYKSPRLSTYRRFLKENRHIFYNFLDNLPSNLFAAEKEIHKTSWKSIDIFSLGITLFELYNKARSLRRIRNEQFCQKYVLPVLYQMTHPVYTMRITIGRLHKKWEILSDIITNRVVEPMELNSNVSSNSNSNASPNIPSYF